MFYDAQQWPHKVFDSTKRLFHTPYPSVSPSHTDVVTFGRSVASLFEILLPKEIVFQGTCE